MHVQPTSKKMIVEDQGIDIYIDILDLSWP